MEGNAETANSNQSFTYFDNFRGISFLNDLFKKHSELFETPTSLNKHSEACGSFVFYLLYSGQLVKPQMLFDEFELFMTNSKPSSMKLLMTNPTKIYSEGLSIISWARYLKETSTFYLFEPILKLNDIVLQSFLQTKKFVWQDSSYTLEDIKPIAFNNVGENIAELLPYIAYLYNFLINCSPYEFNSVANGNVQTVYTQALNQYFENSWRRLIKNYPMLKLEQLYASLDNDSIFKIVDKEDIRNLLKEILEPDAILKIRNTIIENNPDILSACVKDQLMISQENVLQGFHEVFTRLADIVIRSNPINKLIQKIPFFSNFQPNMEITWRIVNWCLCGSSTPFFITDSFEFIPLRKYLKRYPNIPEMSIKTDIQKSIISGNAAFNLSDPSQQIIMGYIMKEFNDLMNDLETNAEMFLPCSTDTSEEIEKELFRIFINGSFANHNTFLSEYLKNIHKTDLLILNSLSASLNKFYQNRFSNNIVRSYIFSYLPEYLLKFIMSAAKHGEYSLKTFSGFVFWCINSEIDEKRISRLLDLEYALMCVHNREFTKLINAMSSRIISIILHNSFIFQPYIKQTLDDIHPWTIGGITLCQKSIISNPLVRGCEYIRRTLGTTEELECFNEWIKRLDNQTINETIEEFIQRNDLGSIKNILISRFNNASNDKRLKCLENWKLEDSKVHIRNDAYFISDSIISEVVQYSFRKQLAKNVQSPDLFWRPLKITTKGYSTTYPSKNKFFIGKIECGSYIIENGEYVQLPVVEYNTTLQTMSIVYQPPNGLKVIKVITPSGLLAENNVFFVFTNGRVSEEWIVKDTEYEGMTKMTTNGGSMKVSPGTFT